LGVGIRVDTSNVKHVMKEPEPRRPPEHAHSAVRVHELRQRAGVPYEVERTICSDCRRLLDERPVRRAAA
jgi:hypothetical protein